MSKVNAGWVEVESTVPVLTYLYSFGPGLARALAVRVPGGYIVVSPPTNAPETAFTELEKRGPVVALVASNAFHHLGIPSWKKRFPNAEVFAPAQAVLRVSKKSGITSVRPLSEAGSILGPDVELVDMPFYKTGEVLVRIRTASGPVWYVTDVIMNMPSLPTPWPIGLLFKWTGSAPGLKLNGVAPLFMMKDKGAVHRWLREEAEKAPPALLIPCHGPDVPMAPAGKELLAILPGT